MQENSKVIREEAILSPCMPKLFEAMTQLPSSFCGDREMVEWGNYAEAYKAIHDKLDEILTKLDYLTDPAVQDVIDRADRVLGRVYGSQGQQLKQRASNHELLVQLVHQGVEY